MLPLLAVVIAAPLLATVVTGQALLLFLFLLTLLPRVLGDPRGAVGVEQTFGDPATQAARNACA